MPSPGSAAIPATDAVFTTCFGPGCAFMRGRNACSPFTTPSRFTEHPTPVGVALLVERAEHRDARRCCRAGARAELPVGALRERLDRVAPRDVGRDRERLLRRARWISAATFWRRRGRCRDTTTCMPASREREHHAAADAAPPPVTTATLPRKLAHRRTVLPRAAIFAHNVGAMPTRPCPSARSRWCTRGRARSSCASCRSRRSTTTARCCASRRAASAAATSSSTPARCRYALPVIPGHEPLGVIEKIGDRAAQALGGRRRRSRRGREHDPVRPLRAVPRRALPACADAADVLLVRAALASRPGLWGAYAEYM